jgi:serine/threonine protein kinase
MELPAGSHLSDDDLTGLSQGTLNPAQAGRLRQHLDGCVECRKRIDALQAGSPSRRLPKPANRDTAPGASSSAPNPALAKPASIPPELAACSDHEIMRELGRGGMGVVYLARNKIMDRFEVLKVLKKSLLERAGAAERFLREIRSAARLSHANVVGAYSAFQVGDFLVFAMEYVSGQDLLHLVRGHGPLQPANASYYIYQAAAGLQHAHEKKMVHRDIKPSNLILSIEGKKHVVKILDFGLAKASSEKQMDGGLTGEGQMLGTPDYVAPEQILSAATADIRADIYSLGCSLYFLLSGRTPFRANSLFELMQAHQSRDPAMLDNLPPGLWAIIMRMMAKDPAARFQTPEAAALALSPYFRVGAPKAPVANPPPRRDAAEPAEAPTAASQQSPQRAENARDGLAILLPEAQEASAADETNWWAEVASGDGADNKDAPFVKLGVKDDSKLSGKTPKAAPVAEQPGYSQPVAERPDYSKPPPIPVDLAPIAVEMIEPEPLEDEELAPTSAVPKGRLWPKMLVAGLVAVLVAAGAIVGAGMMRDRGGPARAQRIATAKAQLDQIVKASSFADAKAFVDGLVQEEPQIAAAIDAPGALRKLEEDEARKDNLLKGKKFEESWKRAEALPLGDPGEALVIKELNRYATTAAEKLLAERYASERGVARKKDQEKSRLKDDERIQKALEGIEADVAAASAATYDLAKLERARTALADAKKRLSATAVEAENANSALQAQVRAAQDKVAFASRVVDGLWNEAKALAKFAEALPSFRRDMAMVRKQLRELAAVFPDGARRRAFEAAAVESETWEIVISWDELLIPVQADYLFLTDARAAGEQSRLVRDWARRMQAALSKDGAVIRSALVNEYGDVLAGISQSDKALAEIQDLFKRDDVRAVYYVRTKDKQNFYSLEDPTDKIAMAKQKLLPSIHFKALGTTVETYVKLADLSDSGWSSQSRIADSVIEELKKPADVKLERLIARIVRDCSAARDSMDPVLALTIVRAVLAAGAKIDPYIAAESAAQRQLIEEACRNGLNLTGKWHDASRPGAEAARTRAAKILSDLPPLTNFASAVTKRRDNLAADIKASRHRLAGWLYQDVESGWKVKLLQPAKTKQELRALHFRGGMPMGWLAIAEAGPGQVTLREDDRTAFAEGRCVFVRVD